MVTENMRNIRKLRKKLTKDPGEMQWHYRTPWRFGIWQDAIWEILDGRNKPPRAKRKDDKKPMQ